MSSQLNSSQTSLNSDASDGFESFGRQQLVDEIKKQYTEYIDENSNINQTLDKLVRGFEAAKRKQSNCQRLADEIGEEQKRMDLKIARMKARLCHIKDAKQVIETRPTELLTKQHLPDPIQQRMLDLVQTKCTIWANKNNMDDSIDDKHDFPKLGEVFPFLK